LATSPPATGLTATQLFIAAISYRCCNWRPRVVAVEHIHLPSWADGGRELSPSTSTRSCGRACGAQHTRMRWGGVDRRGCHVALVCVLYLELLGLSGAASYQGVECKAPLISGHIYPRSRAAGGHELPPSTPILITGSCWSRAVAEHMHRHHELFIMAVRHGGFNSSNRSPDPTELALPHGPFRNTCKHTCAVGCTGQLPFGIFFF
jgi:hypothetical protein